MPIRGISTYVSMCYIELYQLSSLYDAIGSSVESEVRVGIVDEHSATPRTPRRVIVGHSTCRSPTYALIAAHRNTITKIPVQMSSWITIKGINCVRIFGLRAHASTPRTIPANPIASASIATSFTPSPIVLSTNSIS